LPETMRPDNYRKIQVNTKSTVIDQIDALEKIYAVVGEAISKRKLMVKGIDAALGIMDGKTPAKRTPPKKPATPTATTGKRRGRKPAAKVEEEKAIPPNPAPGSTGE
ncbi:MAG: hypothetical protein GY928_22525, partial [Colwellia sp.]|nr:hypothetical protein [Colwellia sp.]